MAAVARAVQANGLIGKIVIYKITSKCKSEGREAA